MAWGFLSMTSTKEFSKWVEKGKKMRFEVAALEKVGRNA